MWRWLRWPIGLVAVTAALATLFKFAPHRRRPAISWLVAGGLAAAVVWAAASVGLAFYLAASGTFGDTYGPLAGFIGLALWTELSAMAILYGVAVAAELEARRCGAGEPVPDPLGDPDRAGGRNPRMAV